MDTLTDEFGRTVDYLRVSVTDRCNLRCVYCSPSNGSKPFDQEAILTFEEIERVVRIAAGLGVRRVRITGGEPLMRKNLPTLVESLRRVHGIEEISLTTNGTLLRSHAHSLASAGLRRVNVSLDSLSPRKFREIRMGAELHEVIEGILAAGNAGLSPVKINMVPIRGVNDREIESFAQLTMGTAYHVRFIELMPVGSGSFWSREKCLPVNEMIRRVSVIAPLYPVDSTDSGPAKSFRFAKGKGLLGFISPISHRFCESCNRLRLTSNGRIRPCLFSGAEIDVRSALRSKASDAAMRALFHRAVRLKPQGHTIPSGNRLEYPQAMSTVGG
ncbi:MAG: GTP 3',8-cyclase MoaA [Syntrophobacteraceae bacterium]